MQRGATQSRWIWPFELVERIGEGGMGVVYRGRYVKNDMSVAVKLLPENVNETILQRFQREMDVLKSLKHPNIVRCFGGVCENRQPFYAMEYVPGGTLEDVVHRHGRLPWEQVVEYAQEMCAALQCAHERGIVHRDVKPANFLVTETGSLKLGDFGLASVAASTKITRAGKTVGTFEYMAPEQITTKQPITPRTDLYALGCVLFEMLTGHPPFAGDSAAAILQQHLHNPPPRVVAELPDCPPEIDRLVAELLEKSPAKRPETAASVAARLRDVAGGGVVQVRRKPRLEDAVAAGTNSEAKTVHDTDGTAKWRTAIAGSARWKWAALALAVLAVLLLAWTASLRSRARLADRAVAAWVDALESPSAAERTLAARALGELARESPGVVDRFAPLIEHEDPNVRAAAIEALGNSGEAAQSHLPTLIRIYRHDDHPVVRQAVAEARSRISQESGPLDL